MRLQAKMIVMLVASFALVACGGGSKGGKSGKSDDRSSFQKLEAMSTELDEAMNKVTGPIDNVDTIVTGIEEMPEKYKLEPDDYKALLTNALSGKDFKIPAGLDEKAAGDLDAFMKKLVDFKDGIVSAPDNAKALVGTLADALTSVPVLVGQVTAETTATQANPFASKEDKAKAKKEANDVKTLQNELTGKIQDVQGKATGLPSKAMNSLGKFVAALSKAGIDNADSLLKTGTGAADDAKGAAKDAKQGAQDTAQGAAEGAAGDAKGAAEGAAQDAAEGAQDAAQDAADNE